MENFEELKDRIGFMLANIRHYFEEDITRTKYSIIGEKLERIYKEKDTNQDAIKIVYTKEKEGDIYKRKSRVYGYFYDGTLCTTPLDERVKSYTKEEIINYKAKLVNNVMNIFISKAHEVDEKAGNTQMITALDALFSEPSIKIGLDYAKQSGELYKLVNAINNQTQQTMPVLFMNVPDFTDADRQKWGLPAGYTPIIKEWIFGYYNESNFKLYNEA